VAIDATTHETKITNHPQRWIEAKRGGRKTEFVQSDAQQLPDTDLGE
jgi:hypothetical protein